MAESNGKHIAKSRENYGKLINGQSTEKKRQKQWKNEWKRSMDKSIKSKMKKAKEMKQQRNKINTN